MTKTTLKCIQVIRLSFYTSLFHLLFSHATSQLNDQEQAVLLKLKQHWQNPQPLGHWTPSSNSSSHCSWPEITCNTDGSVTRLSFYYMNINGTVPPFICDLKNLTTLDLSFNYMTSDEFPRALYNCSKLQYLDLSQNYFAGTVPDDIHRMAQLRQLNLGANSFSGNIPASIGQLTELKELQLFQIQFNGSFPPEIGNLSNLERLELAYIVGITKTMPSEFTKLKKLTYLWVAGSNLIGEIPDKIGEIAALEHLDLSRNNLSGKIPNGLFMLKNLSIVYLYKNNLFGEIPRVIKASNIDVIDLSENSLTGTIPDDFGRLTKLSGLSLSVNQLSGKIPDSLGRLPRLINFNLFANNLSGTLPLDLGQYSMLEEFQVSSNRLIGQLPQHLGDKGRLVGVVAFDNNLSGELPKSIGSCNNLKILDVRNNRFSGNVPSGLWTLNLSSLLLSNNSFTGELPERLSRNLSRIEMSYNRFSGKIPEGVSSWRNLVFFDASNNLLNGTIPLELTALSRLTTLFLHQNLFSGSLPSNIISWKSLTLLNLSRNAISGQIPEKFGSLPVLTDLDLSENQLFGQIPPQLGLLKLTSLNLSSNHLIGRIPSEFENGAYASSFLNNSRLCANSPLLNIHTCNSNLQNSSKNLSKLLAWILGLSIPAALLGLLASFLMIRIYRKRKHALDLTWKLTSFQRLNFTKFDILSGLIENNVIGCGGSGKVYCVAINPSRDFVAVKKIWNDRKLEQKLEKEFLAEVEILSSIRHSNIVKLLCCISSDNSKLLVYEYLKNRSLDLFLDRKSRTSTVSGSVHNDVLDWPKRLQIAIGAAQGLSYMHHDCSPPIVHRDLKSSNILLDFEFNAKIADFGLAKMLSKQGESATMSAVVGSYGYIAPEYAHTIRVNEKIDVYSFGVILLELATGRKASEGDEHTSLAEWAWRHFQEGNPIVDALDEEVKEDCYVDEMCCVFKLGIICTGTLPSTRPSMKEILKILLRCNQPLVYGGKNSEYDAFLHKNSKLEKVLENNDATLASMV